MSDKDKYLLKPMGALTYYQVTRVLPLILFSYRTVTYRTSTYRFPVLRLLLIFSWPSLQVATPIKSQSLLPPAIARFTNNMKVSNQFSIGIRYKYTSMCAPLLILGLKVNRLSNVAARRCFERNQKIKYPILRLAAFNYSVEITSTLSRSIY